MLASSATAGAAEDLLAAFRAAGRGVIIGEPSAGSPGDVAVFALPKSWGVQFSVARHEAPDGAGFAGVGVKPDLLVIRTVNDLLAGREDILFEGMMNADKLHPTLRAYQIWADALKPIFTKLLGPPAREDHAPPPTGDPSVANRPTF